jgi:hypothetical protein
MYRFAAIFALLSATAWGSFSYNRTLTVDHTKVSNTDQVNFPVLVSISDPSLKSATNGGHVRNANGYDICFYADAQHSQPLSWEIEKYDGTAGTMVAWVKIPQLSHTADTVFFLFYGDPSINTPQNAPTGVWDSNFAGVYHLNDNAGNPVVNDSTGLNMATNTANTNAKTTTGQIGGALSFTQTNDEVNAGANSIPTGAAPRTLSVWMKTTSNQNIGVVGYGGHDLTPFHSYDLFLIGGKVALADMDATSINDTVSIADGSYHYLVGAYDGATSYLYVDGVLKGTRTVAEATTNFGIRIGNQTWNNNNPFNGMLDEVRLSISQRSGDWIATEYNNQRWPAAFVTLGGETGSGISSSIATTPAVIPSGVSTTITLAGTGTSWGGGTVFSVSGVPGVTVTGQSVTSATSATITVSAGNSTGPFSVSDGLVNTSVAVGSPGMRAAFSGPWLFQTQTGKTGNGDTWTMMQTVNGIRATLNDGHGINNEIPVGSNIAFYGESPDLSTFTLINGLSGLGAFNAPNFGICSNNGGTMKSQAPISFDGLYLLPVFCNNGLNSAYPSIQVSTAADDGAHWWRIQDATPITSCSWSAGTATCTTPTQTTPLTSGNLAIIEGVNPSGFNGTFTAAAGTNSTSVTFPLASNPGGYVSGGVVLGPGSANGTPHTTSLIDSTTFRIWLAQYNTDNAACCGNLDGNNTYLQTLIYYGAAGKIFNMRIPKATWWDSSTYQYWVSGNTYTSNMNAATDLSCVVNGVASTCSSLGYIMSITYVSDPALPDGGQYLTIGSAGQDAIWTASHIYGPWTLVSSSPIDPGSNPVSYGFANTIPSLYVPISSNPYKARIRVQEGGQYFTNFYYPIHRDVILSLATPNNSPVFNKAATAGIAGRGGPLHHVDNGLQVLWQFQTYGDFLTSPMPDVSGNGNDVTLSAAIANPKYQMFSNLGMENTNPAFNTGWQSQGGAWAVPSGFGQNLGDFSVLFVGQSDLNGTQVAMAGPLNTMGTGFGWYLTGGAMKLSIRGGASADLTCPAPAPNTFFAYIGVRKGGTVYCFKSDTAAATSAGTDGTTLGSYNLWIGGASDWASNFFRGTIGEVAIWNRALCSYQIAGSCRAGQVDEVQREFGVVRAESKTRGWGVH